MLRHLYHHTPPPFRHTGDDVLSCLVNPGPPKVGSLRAEMGMALQSCLTHPDENERDALILLAAQLLSVYSLALSPEDRRGFADDDLDECRVAGRTSWTQEHALMDFSYSAPRMTLARVLWGLPLPHRRESKLEEGARHWGAENRGAQAFSYDVLRDRLPRIEDASRRFLTYQHQLGEQHNRATSVAERYDFFDRAETFIGPFRAFFFLLSAWLRSRDQEESLVTTHFLREGLGRVMHRMFRACADIFAQLPASRQAVVQPTISFLGLVSGTKERLQELTECIIQEGIAVLRIDEACRDPWVTHVLYCFLRRKRLGSGLYSVESYSLLREWALQYDLEDPLRGPFGSDLRHGSSFIVS